MAKVKKDQVLQIRCTTGFKEHLKEIAEINNMAVAELIENACNDIIKRYLVVKDIQLNKSGSDEYNQVIANEVILMKDKKMKIKDMAKALNEKGLYSAVGNKWDSSRLKDFIRRHVYKTKE